MTTITTRAGKGSPLTHNEVDANFTNLNTDKVEGAASSTDNAIVRFDGAGGKTAQNSGVLITDANEVTLPVVASPATPATDNLNIVARKKSGLIRPAFVRPNGLVSPLQSDISEFRINRYQPATNSNLLVGDGSLPLVATGTATAVLLNIARLFTAWPRVEAQVSVASATAVAGFRSGSGQVRIGRDASAPGGFYYRCAWGPALGVSTATTRGFAGLLTATTAPTDVEPSSQVNGVWMGWDAADTNVQMMHNDGAGTATKIDLGVNFPVPTVDRTTVYDLELYSENSLTQAVNYRVVRYDTTGLTIAAEATGTISTDIPAVGTYLSPRAWMSVGGTSSVIAIALFGMHIETEF